MRYRIADVRLEVRCPPGPALDDVVSRYGAFEVETGASDLLVEVETEAGFENARPSRRPYPGVDARREGDRYFFDRQDLAVTLDVSDAGGRVAGRIRDGVSSLDTVLRAALSVLLPRRGGLLLHASGVDDGGRAFLFSGRSGAGKSTAAELTGVRTLLSDDIVALSIAGGRPLAHAVPFSGLFAPPTSPRAIPVEVLCLVEKSDAHVLESLPRATALGRLLGNVLHLPIGDAATADVLRVAEAALLAIPARRLRFRRDPGFWEGLREVGGRPLDGPLSLDRGGGGVYDGGSQ